MNIITITGNIGRLLNVFRPVATLFSRINHIDTHHTVLLAVRIDVITGNPDLAGILDAGHKIFNILFFFLNALQLLYRLGYVLFSQQIGPKILVDFNLVLNRRMILQLGFFPLTNQPLDVKPVASKNRSIVG